MRLELVVIYVLLILMALVVLRLAYVEYMMRKIIDNLTTAVDNNYKSLEQLFDIVEGHSQSLTHNFEAISTHEERLGIAESHIGYRVDRRLEDVQPKHYH